MSRFTKDSVAQFYGEHQDKPFYPALEEFVTSDVCIGMELASTGAISGWREFIGPTNSEVAKAQKPGSLRAIFGTDGTKNAVHGSDS